MTESKQFIGWILVRPMDFFGDVPQWEELEIGWRFKQETWGKGIGTEAAKQVMDAVVELGVAKSICAIAMEDNIGINRDYEKAWYEVHQNLFRFSTIWSRFCVNSFFKCKVEKSGRPGSKGK
jgi:RimJ/RimL family protein N-acetyltransferase